jgi:signal transduction histidine kinase
VVANKERERGGVTRRGSAVDKLDRIFEECAGPLLIQRDARRKAHRRALAAVEGSSSRGGAVALLTYAADVIIAHAVDLAANQPELTQLIERIDSTAGIPRVALAREVLGAPQFLQLPSAVALEVQLALLLAFAEAKAVSLWTAGPSAQLKQVAYVGEIDGAGADARRLARSLLGVQREKPPRTRALAGVVLERWQQPAAALISSGKGAAARKPILESAGAMLGATLERDELLARGRSSEEELRVAAERRLTRLRFDLHDGPQQDVIMLAEDLRLLNSQLESVMDGHRDKQRVLGRLDDLQARLVAIDGDLRRISAFVQSPFLQSESVPEALLKLTEDFAARTGIEPELRLEGDFSGLTDSQQITLLGLIREALSNIREHSGAENVAISLSAGRDGVEATVTDDGRGFDPETTLVEAARGGHLGLVGMHERVHLLGGRTQIESRPGGPTVISVSLPPFRIADRKG